MKFRKFSDSWQLNVGRLQINHYPPLSKYVPGSKVPRHTHVFWKGRPNGWRLPI